MGKNKLTLGADPEILVVTGGKVGHCIGLLGGSKEAPRAVDCGAVQEDNVLFEFNINPASEYKDFTNNISKVMEQGQAILGNSFEFSKKASHIFTPAELSMMPEQAHVFGCDPDFNALTGMVNPKPKAANAGLRTAGGHVHFGYADVLKEKGIIADDAKAREIIVLADYFLALPSLLIDTDDSRRELYGKAGAFRIKPYGAEYRTLSNFWIFDEANRRFIWDQSQKVVENLPNLMELVAKVNPQQLHEVINTSNRKMAEQLIKTLKVA